MHENQISEEELALAEFMSTASEEAQAVEKKEPTENDLKAISSLARQKLELEAKVEQEEAALALTKESLRLLTEVSLPKAMEAVGMKEFKLIDGSTVTIKQDVLASIKKDNQDAAFEWLDAIGQGGIIKTEVSMPFARGQAEEVEN